MVRARARARAGEGDRRMLELCMQERAFVLRCIATALGD